MVNGAEDIENSPEHPRILEVPGFCYGGTRITEYVEMIFSVIKNRSDKTSRVRDADIARIELSLPQLLREVVEC